MRKRARYWCYKLSQNKKQGTSKNVVIKFNEKRYVENLQKHVETKNNLK